MPQSLVLFDQLARIRAKLTFINRTLCRSDYIELQGEALSGLGWFLSETIEEVRALEGHLKKDGVK